MKETIRKRRQLRFDEINNLVERIAVNSVEEYQSLTPVERRKRKDEFWDCLWDWLIDGWAAGLLFVGKDKDIPDLTNVLNWVYPRGESVSEIYDKDITDKDKFQRMVECEANRVWNTGFYEAGKGEGLMKTWETMLDDRVRDSHDFLEGETIPFDDEFVTLGGDSALAPGMFQDPENNCNCRCWISYKQSE